MKKVINIDDWPRKKAFKTFYDFDDPYTGITTTLNITNLVHFVKNTNNSFYGTMLYFVLMSLDKVDAFKYGYGKDVKNILQVCKYDDIAATTTVLSENGELNFTRYIKFDANYEDFIREFCIAKSDAENNAEYYKIPNQDNMNKVQVTCLPWIKFSNFKDAITKTEKSSKPKICWGKYYKINDEYFIDFSLLVNHAFQDGIHIAMLINELQNNILNINLEFLTKESKYVKTKKKNNF
mgnify:CR=1 FL=1